MRILHLSTFLQGGAGRAITELAVAQKAHGLDVLVAIDAREEAGYESYREYLDRLDASGIAVLRVRSTFKRDLGQNLGAVAALRSAAAVGRLDLIHAHAAIPSLIGRLLARRVPVVQTMHGWGVTKTPEQSAADVIVLNLLDRIVVPSQASASLLRSLGVDPALLTVVPYGVPDQAAEPIDEADEHALAGLRERARIVVGCVGTIGDRKNQRLLVDALTDVEARDVAAVFVGDGDVQGLESYCRERGVEDRTLVLGYRRQAGRYLRVTEACVLPSRSEGQPLTIIEAFRDGIPVIAAGIPELGEVIDHGVTGLLFTPGDGSSLAAALSRIGRTTTRSLTTAARTAYERRYTAALMIDAYASVYAAAMSSTYAEAS